MVTLTDTAKVAAKVTEAIESAGENPHSVAIGTGIPYQTLRRLMRGDEASPFNVRQLEQIAKYLRVASITEFLDVA